MKKDHDPTSVKGLKKIIKFEEKVFFTFFLRKYDREGNQLLRGQ